MTENFKSNFVFGLQGKQCLNFIEKIAKPEIQKIIGTNDYEIISFENHLSFQDFKETDDIVSHIYTAFLSDIKKENGKVSFKKKVCITLDERLCTDICPNTGRKITSIKLGGVELAYFIYFDITEFFDFVYGNEIQKRHSQKDENIKPENDSKSNNELLDDKVENIEKFDDSKSTALVLDESIIPKLFSGNKNNESNLNNANYDYIEKIGYIHRKEIVYSRVMESLDEKSNFIIPHSKEFPEMKYLPIGTAIKVLGKFDSDGKFFVDIYEEIEIDELPFQVMKLSGTLLTRENSNFAIIRTGVGDVYAKFDLIKNFEPNIIHQVKCVAVEAYNSKKQENGWRAVWVESE